ncbi:uncharacterized protein LOC125587291 [Brassica napus]|uniref:uncharacterized protein LOC125587291 n=1 Tax=Brassica napus TaxID=3708 RepID=UPI00207AB836|nr:uncharacterized protein LOC125587291 [Brassica napus]
MREVVRSFHNKDLGNGRQTSFWFDNWLDRGVLVNVLGERGMVDMGINRSATVEEALQSVRRRRRHKASLLNDIEADLILVKEKLRSEVSDTNIWRRKSGFKPKFSTYETWSLLRSPGVVCDWSSGIWFTNVTPKFAFVTWLAVRDRLSTMDRIVKWDPGAVEMCVLCKNASETRSHLFFECSYSAQVWEYLMKGVLCNDYTSAWSELLILINDERMENKKKFCLIYALQATVHALWRERNRIKHEENPMPIEILMKLLEKGNGSDTCVYGEWVVKGSLREFVVNNRKGGRMFLVSDGCTHGELLEMALEDYGLDKKIEKMVLTYSLLDVILQQMAPDTPHMHVTNDRQVRNLIE